MHGPMTYQYEMRLRPLSPMVLRRDDRTSRFTSPEQIPSRALNGVDIKRHTRVTPARPILGRQQTEEKKLYYPKRPSVNSI